MSEKTNHYRLSRRDAIKTMLAGGAGLWVALNLPDWMFQNQYTEWFGENIWGYGEAMVRASIPRKTLQLQIDPGFLAAPYEVTLTHIIAPRENSQLESLFSNSYDAAVPNQAIFEAAKYLKEQSQEAIYAPPNSTGSLGIIIASMYPEKVLARKAASIEYRKLLKEVDPNQETNAELSKDGSIQWKIGDKYGGAGKAVALSEKPLKFVYKNGGEDDFVGMTPRQWLKSTTGKTVKKAYCTNSFAGVSLEHTVPSVWIAETTEGPVALAGNYANLSTFAYSPQVVNNNAVLDPIQRNVLVTPSPFTHFGEKLTRHQATVLSQMSEKGFNQWKTAYPGIRHSVNGLGDTMVYNSQTGLFQFVNYENREKTISGLSESEIWTTPGETFTVDGPNHYRGVNIFGTPWDLTLNGMMLVPEKDGFRPVSFITTDQNMRFSLFQAQEMVQQIGRKMGVPKGSAFVNWDRHGAGGLFMA